jgi:hypothetical protein
LRRGNCRVLAPRELAPFPLPLPPATGAGVPEGLSLPSAEASSPSVLGTPSPVAGGRGRGKGASLPTTSSTTLPLLALLTLLPLTAYAQDTPPPASSTPPVPTINGIPFKVDHMDKVTVEAGPKGELRTIITGRPILAMLDLRLEADRLEMYTQEVEVQPGKKERHLFIEAVGDIVMKRGDEELRGTSFILESDVGNFDAKGATVISPPFYIRAERVSRTPEELRAEHAHVTPSANGRGEFGMRVGDLRLIDGRKIVVRDATLYLWGTRLITLRHLAFTIRTRDTDPNEARRVAPVSLRISQISGVAFGTGVNFTPVHNLDGTFILEQTTKQGTQYQASLRAGLFNFPPGPPSRRLAATPGGINPALVNASPIRQLATARPLPPAPNPVLDFETILVTPNTLSRPTRAADRDVHLELNMFGNREVGGRRQGPLLVSRTPEAVLTARIPLSRALNPDDNVSALRALRSPRPYLMTDFRMGSYQEIRLNNNRTKVDQSRVGFSLGIGTMPILIGDRFLVSGQILRQGNTYEDDNHYGFTEATLAGTYILGWRTTIGGAVITRDSDGRTPFFWDQVDTQSEAHLYGQTALLNGKYTLAALGRYDIRQHKFFDTEIAVAVRGKNIEPRFSYRTLNSQFGFGLALPGITTR